MQRRSVGILSFGFVVFLTIAALVVSLIYNGGTAFASTHSLTHVTPQSIQPNAFSPFGPGLTRYPTTIGMTAYLSWTGTNGHINIHQATNGDCSYGCLGDATVSDTSLDTPALAEVSGNIYVAWMGTENSIPHVHVARYDGSSTLKNGVVPSTNGQAETTNSAPSLLILNGLFYLAWRGANNQINFETSPDGKTWGSKVVLADTSSSGLALAIYQGLVYIAWPGTDGNHTINLGYFNGSSHIQNKHVYSGQSTFDHLGLAANNTYLYVAWAGNDASHHLNVARFDGSGFGGKYTRSDTAVAGPSLAWYGDNSIGFGVNIAWTGTNSQKSVNVDVTTES